MDVYTLIKKTPQGGSSACLFLLKYGKNALRSKGKGAPEEAAYLTSMIKFAGNSAATNLSARQVQRGNVRLRFALPFKFGIAKTVQNHLDYRLREESNRQKQGYLCKNCKARGINNIRSEMQVRG